MMRWDGWKLLTGNLRRAGSLNHYPPSGSHIEIPFQMQFFYMHVRCFSCALDIIFFEAFTYAQL
jgi:hypothetical protein